MASRRSPQSPASPARPAVVTHQPESRVRVILELPGSLFDLFEEQGMATGRLVEEEIIQRLHKCKDHTALKPLYLNDEQRSRLERALEHNISSADVAIAQIVAGLSIQVGDVGVEIPSHLARRISTRIFRGEDYESVVRREVIKALEVFTGMRPA